MKKLNKRAVEFNSVQAYACSCEACACLCNCGCSREAVRAELYDASYIVSQAVDRNYENQQNIYSK